MTERTHTCAAHAQALAFAALVGYPSAFRVPSGVYALAAGTVIAGAIVLEVGLRGAGGGGAVGIELQLLMLALVAGALFTHRALLAKEAINVRGARGRFTPPCQTCHRGVSARARAPHALGRPPR